MDSVFNVAYMAIHDVLGIHVSKQVAALIMGGVLIGLLARASFAHRCFTPSPYRFSPSSRAHAPYCRGSSCPRSCRAAPGYGGRRSHLRPANFWIFTRNDRQIGNIGNDCRKIGSKLGMSEDEINTLNAALRGVVGMLTLSAGMSVSSSFGKLSEGDQKLVDKEIEKKGDMDSAESGNRPDWAATEILGHVTTLNELATKKAASPEEIEKKQKELHGNDRPPAQNYRSIEKTFSHTALGRRTGGRQLGYPIHTRLN